MSPYDKFKKIEDLTSKAISKLRSNPNSDVSAELESIHKLSKPSTSHVKPADDPPTPPQGPPQ